MSEIWHKSRTNFLSHFIKIKLDFCVDIITKQCDLVSYNTM